MTRELVVTPLSTVTPRRVKWAYQDLVPMGVPTIIAGRGGIGKSTILSWLAAGITRGVFPGDLHGKGSAVGFISSEDDLATTLAPRLTAAGADLDLIQDFSAVKVTEDGNEWTGLPTIADDLSELKNALVEWGTKVLVIDPVVSLMSGDSIKASDVRRNLDPIAGLAAELGIAPILVMHFGKGSGNASDKMSGSHAFRDIARSVLLLAIDEETDQRILTVDKSNYSQRSPSMAFDIATVAVETSEGDALVGKAQLLGETTLTVHDIVRRADDESLSMLSTEVLEFINEHPEGVEMSRIISEFKEDESAVKIRVYVSRLADGGRIRRVSRGLYAPVTSTSSVTSVTSVTNSLKVTEVTKETGGAADTKPRCRVCGNLAHPALAPSYIHPECASEVADAG